jgi:hypothetical protein
MSGRVNPVPSSPADEADDVEFKDDDTPVAPVVVESRVRGDLKADGKRSCWKRWFACCVTRKTPELTQAAVDAAEMLRCTLCLNAAQ